MCQQLCRQSAKRISSRGQWWFWILSSRIRRPQASERAKTRVPSSSSAGAATSPGEWVTTAWLFKFWGLEQHLVLDGTGSIRRVAMATVGCDGERLRGSRGSRGGEESGFKFATTHTHTHILSRNRPYVNTQRQAWIECCPRSGCKKCPAPFLSQLPPSRRMERR